MFKYDNTQVNITIFEYLSVLLFVLLSISMEYTHTTLEPRFSQCQVVYRTDFVRTSQQIRVGRGFPALVAKTGGWDGTSGRVGFGWIQSGSGPLRVGGGAPEGPGERGESGAQEDENM